MPLRPTEVSFGAELHSSSHGCASHSEPHRWPKSQNLADGTGNHLVAGQRQERSELLLAVVATEVSRRPNLDKDRDQELSEPSDSPGTVITQAPPCRKNDGVLFCRLFILLYSATIDLQ